MNNIDITTLRELFLIWMNQIILKGEIKNALPEYQVSDSCFKIECATPYDYKTKIGFVVMDKYHPDDKRIINIFQGEFDNVIYIIEDGEKIYHNRYSKHSIGIPCEETRELAERIAKVFHLEYIKPIKSHRINDYISVSMEKPDKFMYLISQFMTRQILAHRYIVFQSDFGFAGTDVPFTMAVKRTDLPEETLFEFRAWSQDWSSFTIEDFATDTLLPEWTCPRLFDDYPELKEKNAREIIESEHFVDKDYYSFMSTTVSSPMQIDDKHIDLGLETSIWGHIFTALYEEYDLGNRDEDDCGCGKVAVIYKED